MRPCSTNEVTAVFAVTSAATGQETGSERAMARLREAVKPGYKDVTHVRNDTDLDPLRSRAAVQKLLADLDGPRKLLPTPRAQGAPR